MLLVNSLNVDCILNGIVYCIEEKFGREKFSKFGEMFLIHQTKTIQLMLTFNNLLIDLLILKSFLPNEKVRKFAKVSHLEIASYLVNFVYYSLKTPWICNIFYIVTRL